jgi:hypothetical protein
MESYTMKHLAMIGDWNRITKSEKIYSVNEVLSAFGKVRVEYLKGRSSSIIPSMMLKVY